MAKRIEYAPLTDDQKRELTRFIAGRGRGWKADLRRCWEDGRGRIVAELQQLRNTHGPRWLKTYIHG